jgi:hypothetical protein
MIILNIGKNRVMKGSYRAREVMGGTVSKFICCAKRRERLLNYPLVLLQVTVNRQTYMPSGWHNIYAEWEAEMTRIYSLAWNTFWDGPLTMHEPVHAGQCI